MVQKVLSILLAMFLGLVSLSLVCTQTGHIPILGGRENTSPLLYVNLSSWGVRSAALCPLLCQPGKPPALHSWGRAFFLQQKGFFPALKMFSCHLGLKFMAQGMDVWITCCRFWEPESPGWGCSLVLGQSKAAHRGRSAEETWNWHSVVSGTCFFYRKVGLSMPSSVKVFRQSGVEAKSKAVSMAANSESSGVSEAGCSVLTFLCII